jgi:hypothetical protein
MGKEDFLLHILMEKSQEMLGRRRGKASDGTQYKITSTRVYFLRVICGSTSITLIFTGGK